MLVHLIAGTIVQAVARRVPAPHPGNRMTSGSETHMFQDRTVDGAIAPVPDDDRPALNIHETQTC